MKKLSLHYLRNLILFAAIILAVSPLAADTGRGAITISNSVNSKQETVVYVTKTGKKYHRSDCRYLSQSKIKTTLKKAVADGNGACKVCKP